jgi:hypothetical protein
VDLDLTLGGGGAMLARKGVGRGRSLLLLPPAAPVPEGYDDVDEPVPAVSTTDEDDRFVAVLFLSGG